MVGRHEFALLSLLIFIFICVLIYRLCSNLGAREQKNFKHTSYILREKELEEVISSSPKLDGHNSPSINEIAEEVTKNESSALTQNPAEDEEQSAGTKSEIDNDDNDNGLHDKEHTDSNDVVDTHDPKALEQPSDLHTQSNKNLDDDRSLPANQHDEQHRLLDSTSGDEGQESED